MRPVGVIVGCAALAAMLAFADIAAPVVAHGAEPASVTGSVSPSAASSPALVGSATRSLAPTATVRYRARGLRVVTGKGSKYAKGANVAKIAMASLKKIKARNVTVYFDWACTRKRGVTTIAGRVWNSSRSTIHLCTVGDFDFSKARRALTFVVAHEYGHIRNNRYRNSSKLPRSVRPYLKGMRGEKVADCQAARTTGLSIREFGVYTKTCTGAVGNAAKRVAKLP